MTAAISLRDQTRTDDGPAGQAGPGGPEGWTVVLSGVVGLTAAGLSCSHSPVEQVTVTDTAAGVVGFATPEPGAGVVAVHSLTRFVEQATACYPAALELLWAPPQCHLRISPHGRRLVDGRDAFLSAAAVRLRYVGAAHGMLCALRVAVSAGAAGGADRDRHRRICVCARELARLVCQGRGLYRTGRLRVWLSQADARWCRDLAQDLLNGGGLRTAEALVAEFTAEMDDRPTPLPELPDLERIRTVTNP